MNKKLPLNQVSTVLLRGIVILIGIFVLGLCFFVLPLGIMNDRTGMYGPILAGLYIPAVPFFYALFQALKLLDNIDNNQAFTALSVQAFKRIKYCAGIISGIFAAGSPYVYYVADKDDAPGVLLVALVIVGASFVIATFSAVMQKLVQNAVDIKAENDLTV